ncbi:4'-phosphopantetheinyl transferase [Actinomyces slackii]|uniref:Phosphopantetheinyltransferase component of enterobactin synthase multienzyme complex n=1 Tax=Actinomyces slackii TaxID=52774 RepID=A0A3S4WJK2_9ACTO|nr:4'-phosphopantetheinyl transferase superfamily protein [Actinomyces slackii]VEG74309.1 phosphopantetheinyltransferase component of enterobactin synthase multienzyme complex [Actinomyces slackii]
MQRETEASTGRPGAEMSSHHDLGGGVSPQEQWLRSLLPPSVAVVETTTDRDLPLARAEREAVARAVERRRAEFTTVRWCAAQALGELGHERPVQVPGPHGEPVWPAGVVGSMTHCQGYRAAAVARRADMDSIGIDAEPNDGLPPGLLDEVASQGECRACADLAARCPGVAFDRLLFSIKECVFKAWFPREGGWLDFSDAEVAISADGRFSALVSRRGTSRRLLGGRWLAKDGLLVAALTVPAGGWDRS